MDPEGSLLCSQDPVNSEASVTCNKLFFFPIRGLLAPRPIPRLEGLPLSVVRYCLFNIFIGGSISGGRLLRPRPGDNSCCLI